MPRALQAGACYFAIVFAIGFVLGIARTLLLASRIGELPAVVIELPVILVCAWIVSRRLIAGFRLAPGLRSGLVMGATALVLLLAAEAALSVLVFGRSPGDYLATMTTAHGLLGLAGQLLFGLIPVTQLAGRPAA